MSTNVILPQNSIPIETTEYNNITPAKANIIKQIADITNRNRSMQKLVCAKAFVDEAFEADTSSITYPNKYTYNCIARLRADLPVDIEETEAHIDIWFKAVGPNNGGLAEFVAVQGSSSGANYEWKLEGELEVPNLSSDTYFLVTLRGTIYPQKKLNTTINTNDPQWLTLYMTSWSGVNPDIPYINAIAMYISAKQEMDVDLDVSTSPNNTLNGAVLTPYINQKITAEDWRDFRHSMERVHEASTHYLEIWMDLEDNINDTGYSVTATTGGVNALNLDQFLIPKLGAEEDGDVGNFQIGFYGDVVDPGSYTYELEFYDPLTTTFARVWSETITNDGWIYDNFEMDLSEITNNYVRGRLLVSIATGTGEIKTNGFGLRKYRY